MRRRFRVVQPWQHDAWMLTASVAIAALFLAVVKINVKVEGLISPLPDGEVTVYKVTETKIERVKVSEVVDRIWQLESSRGKARVGLGVFCEHLGMSNEYGYGGMEKKICFRNHKEATAMVHLWFNTQLETKTLEQSICYYNTGRPIDDCEYLRKYILLTTKSKETV